jgi:hypothetical protein
LLSKAASGEVSNENDPISGEKPTWAAFCPQPSLSLQLDSSFGSAASSTWPTSFDKDVVSSPGYSSGLVPDFQYGLSESSSGSFDDLLYQVYG